MLATTVAILFGLAIPRVASAGGPDQPDPPPLGSLRDDSRILGDGPSTAALRDRVSRAAVRAGMPIAVAIVAGGPPSSRSAEPVSLEETARLRFAAQGLSDGSTGDAVLLVVAPRAGHAALETGKGEAGIVPEIDARRITADLTRALRRHASAASLARALAEAVDRIADSALATRERRRPLADSRASERDELRAPSPARDRPSAATAGEKRADAPPRRSLMPGAYALAILVILGLALRHRRRFGSEARSESDRRR